MYIIGILSQEFDYTLWETTLCRYANDVDRKTVWKTALSADNNDTCAKNATIISWKETSEPTRKSGPKSPVRPLVCGGQGILQMLAYLFQSWPSLIYRWIVEAKLKMPEPKITKKTIEIESGEMWHFRQKKKNKKWIIKALDRCTGKTIYDCLGYWSA